MASSVYGYNERTVNDLNQVTEQEVGGDTWTLTYDDNGNLIGKTDGVDTWIYSWTGDENRLVRVQGPGGVDVRYTYDQIGRMLTRDDGQLTQFCWSGWDCVREVSPGRDLIYHIPDGMLQSFSLNGEVFQVVSDALASVRMITDGTGAVVARMEQGAYGETIFVSAIPELENFPYSWVGGLGCRTDHTTSLVYMRQRWYEPSLQRFISRDPMRLESGTNLYRYTRNNPMKWVDPKGLEESYVSSYYVPRGERWNGLYWERYTGGHTYFELSNPDYDPTQPISDTNLPILRAEVNVEDEDYGFEALGLIPEDDYGAKATVHFPVINDYYLKEENRIRMTRHRTTPKLNRQIIDWIKTEKEKPRKFRGNGRRKASNCTTFDKDMENRFFKMNFPEWIDWPKRQYDRNLMNPGGIAPDTPILLTA